MKNNFFEKLRQNLIDFDESEESEDSPQNFEHMTIKRNSVREDSFMTLEDMFAEDEAYWKKSRAERLQYNIDEGILDLGNVQAFHTKLNSMIDPEYNVEATPWENVLQKELLIVTETSYVTKEAVISKDIPGAKALACTTVIELQTGEETEEVPLSNVIHGLPSVLNELPDLVESEGVSDQLDEEEERTLEKMISTLPSELTTTIFVVQENRKAQRIMRSRKEQFAAYSYISGPTLTFIVHESAPMCLQPRKLSALVRWLRSKNLVSIPVMVGIDRYEEFFGDWKQVIPQNSLDGSGDPFDKPDPFIHPVGNGIKRKRWREVIKIYGRDQTFQVPRSPFSGKLKILKQSNKSIKTLLDRVSEESIRDAKAALASVFGYQKEIVNFEEVGDYVAKRLETIGFTIELISSKTDPIQPCSYFESAMLLLLKYPHTKFWRKIEGAFVFT
jgi:hypothetical protein